MSTIPSEFKSIFKILPYKQQKIFTFLQSFHRSCQNVFPSHETIAKACKCSIRTVIRAMNFFRQMKWIGTIKRAYRSCLYFLHQALIWLDVHNPENFRPEKPQNVTENVTIYRSHVGNKNPIGNGSPKNDGKEQEKILEKVGVSKNDQNLLKKYSPSVIIRAIEDAVYYSAKEKIRNIAGYLTSRCKKYSQRC